jgi:hypothetical protein
MCPKGVVLMFRLLKADKRCLKDNMNSLLGEIGMKVEHLAKITGVSEVIIHKLCQGDEAAATSADLQKVAEYFGLNEGQLLARKRWPKDRSKGSHMPTPLELYTKIPLLHWDELEQGKSVDNLCKSTVRFSWIDLLGKDMSFSYFSVLPPQDENNVMTNDSLFVFKKCSSVERTKMGHLAKFNNVIDLFHLEVNGDAVSVSMNFNSINHKKNWGETKKVNSLEIMGELISVHRYLSERKDEFFRVRAVS